MKRTDVLVRPGRSVERACVGDGGIACLVLITRTRDIGIAGTWSLRADRMRDEYVLEAVSSHVILATRVYELTKCRANTWKRALKRALYKKISTELEHKEQERHTSSTMAWSWNSTVTAVICSGLTKYLPWLSRLP